MFAVLISMPILAIYKKLTPAKMAVNIPKTFDTSDKNEAISPPPIDSMIEATNFRPRLRIITLISGYNTTLTARIIPVTQIAFFIKTPLAATKLKPSFIYPPNTGI